MTDLRERLAAIIYRHTEYVAASYQSADEILDALGLYYRPKPPTVEEVRAGIVDWWMLAGKDEFLVSLSMSPYFYKGQIGIRMPGRHGYAFPLDEFLYKEGFVDVLWAPVLRPVRREED